MEILCNWIKASTLTDAVTSEPSVPTPSSSQGEDILRASYEDRMEDDIINKAFFNPNRASVRAISANCWPRPSRAYP